MIDWLVTPALAVTLQDVPPDAGSGGLIVLLVLAIAGGLVYLKVKKPARFDKLMHRAQEVQHSIGPLFDGAKSAVETQLHRFEAEKAPKAAPAVAPTPTSEAMQLAAKLETLKREHGLTDEQIGRIIFGGETPPAVVQVVDKVVVNHGVKVVNGTIVV